MFSMDNLNKIAQMFNFNMESCNTPNRSEGKADHANHRDRDHGKSNGGGGICPESEVSLTPSQLLVIAGFVAKVLEVNSITVDKDQEIQIVLNGSLKRPTQLDNIMQQIGQMPFETVFSSLLKNLG
jgi:hypothetical protein